MSVGLPGPGALWMDFVIIVAAVGLALFCAVSVWSYPKLRNDPPESRENMRRAQKFTLVGLLLVTEGTLLIYWLATRGG
jgi:hypothetical protein